MDIDLLAKMVKNLILDNDRVVLPGIGCFVAEVVPSTFSDKGYTINPPYRRLYFRSKPDEGNELIAFYAKANNVPEAVAESVACDFLTDVREILYVKKTVTFPGLGRLRATKENDIFFVADEDLDIYPAGFGLEPISLKTHSEGAVQQVPVPDEIQTSVRSESLADTPVKAEQPAADSVSEQSPSAETNPEPAPEPTPESTPEPISEPTPEAAPEPAPVSEPTPEPVAAQRPEQGPAPESVIPDEPESVPTPVSLPSSEPVLLAPVSAPAPLPASEPYPAPVEEYAPVSELAQEEQGAYEGEDEPYDDRDEPKKNFFTCLLQWLLAPEHRVIVCVVGGLILLVLLFFLIFAVLSGLFPEWMDSMLYSPEELEILNRLSY